jgi:hypothetical protein
MCLVGVEKNCPGENFAAAVGARRRWSRCRACAERSSVRRRRHFTNRAELQGRLTRLRTPHNREVW